MGAGVVIRGDGIARMRKLGIELRGSDKLLRAELQAELRAAAAPIVADVKSAVQAIPTGSGQGGRQGGGAFARAAYATRAPRGGHGLRATIAAATGMQARTSGRLAGVRIRVNVAKLPPDQRTLPRHLDNPSGWRHPVFGHDVWVHQDGHPYFAVTIRKHQAAAAARIEAAMDTTAAKLTR